MEKIGKWLDDRYAFFERQCPALGRVAHVRYGVSLLLLFKILLFLPLVPEFYRFNVSALHHGQMSWYFLPGRFAFLPFFKSVQGWLWTAFALVVVSSLLLRHWLLALAIACISANFLLLQTMSKNGGDLLLNFLVLGLVFLPQTKIAPNKRALYGGIWLLMQLNICYFYLYNGYIKLLKPMWLNGQAIFASFSLDYYANPHFIAPWLKMPIFCVATAWLTMLFELSFGFLIWFRSCRKWVLGFGVLFHLGIGLLLSLPDFSLTMMVSYLLFAQFGHKKSDPIQDR